VHGLDPLPDPRSGTKPRSQDDGWKLFGLRTFRIALSYFQVIQDRVTLGASIVLRNSMSVSVIVREIVCYGASWNVCECKVEDAILWRHEPSLPCFCAFPAAARRSPNRMLPTSHSLPSQQASQDTDFLNFVFFIVVASHGCEICLSIFVLQSHFRPYRTRRSKSVFFESRPSAKFHS
jgi:hypothetical protein